MATTNNPKAICGAPTHNSFDWSAAKDYFIHRRNTDRNQDARSKVGNYSKPDPTFFLMPLKLRSNTDDTIRGTSLLCLPGELILAIAEQLAPFDLLSFRTTCEYIWSQTSTKGIKMRLQPYFFTARDRDKHAWRLRKDRFNQLAEHDVVNRLSAREKLLCSYCVDYHPLCAFGAVVKAGGNSRAAYERRCAASTATVYICPHKQLTFEDLLGLRIRTRSGRCIRCSFCIPRYSPSTKPGQTTHRNVESSLACLPAWEDAFSLKRRTAFSLDYMDSPWRTIWYPALISGNISRVSLTITTTTLGLV
jgi:hypothetical protein